MAIPFFESSFISESHFYFWLMADELDHKVQKCVLSSDDNISTRNWSPVPGEVLTMWQLDFCEWSPPNICLTHLVLSTASHTASHLCTSLSSIDKEFIAEIHRWFSLLLFLLAPKMLKSMRRLWNSISSSISHFVLTVIWASPDSQIRLSMWFIYFIKTLTKKSLSSASASPPQSFLRA